MKATLLKEFERHAVIDRRKVEGITGSGAYASLLLHRLKKSGQIFEIERNRYTVHKDAFLVASRISWPSYISIWSALRYHNLTEQIPQTIWVVTTKKRRNARLTFAGTKIVFILTSPKYFFGFEKVDFKGIDVFIADSEKSVIDSMLFRRVSVSEIFSILESNLDSIRAGRLLNYAVRTGNKAMIKRLGFLLDKLGKDYFERLKKYVYPACTPLEYNLSAKGELNAKWRIVENVRL